MVHIGIRQEGIRRHRLAEGILEVIEPDDAQLQGRNLIPEPPAEIADIAEGGRKDVAGVFGPVLEVVGQRNVRSRDGTAAETRHRKAQQLGKAQACRDTEFRRAHGPVDLEVLADLHLEIAHETDVEPFSAVEDVLVVVPELRRQTDQTVGVRRSLDVEAETAGVRRQDADGAVHPGGIPGGQLDIDAVEVTDGRQAVVGIRDDILAKGAPRNDAVDLPEELFPEGHRLRVGNGDFPEAVPDEFPGAFFRLIPGVFLDPHRQDSLAGMGQGIGDENVIVLRKVEIAAVAQPRRRAAAFRREVRFREIGAAADRQVRRVGIKVGGDVSPGRDVEEDIPDRIAASGADFVADAHPLSLRLVGVAVHLGAVISDILKMIPDVVHGYLHEIGIIYDRRLAEAADGFVDPFVGVAAGPVVDVQKRAPAEDNAGIGLLADIVLEVRIPEIGRIPNVDDVALQPVLSLLEKTRRTAGPRDKGGGKHEEGLP